MIDKLNRKQIRYLMFRFKNEALSDGKSIRGAEAKDLLEGWGHKTTKTKANGVIGDIKDAYESQEQFGGWDHFGGEYGVAASWDIGMYDSNLQGPLNIALMISRPHKWFLFGIDKGLCVNTRSYKEDVVDGLDYFEGRDLALSSSGVKERRIKLGMQGDGRRRDPMYYQNDGRDFAYESILKFATNEEISQWL